MFQVLKTSMPTSTRCLTSRRFDDPQRMGFVAYKPRGMNPRGSCCTSFGADCSIYKDNITDRRNNGVGYLILTSFERYRKPSNRCYTAALKANFHPLGVATIYLINTCFQQMTQVVLYPSSAGRRLSVFS